jgi:cobalt-zinc-cadmium efflux system membrane fusion protein
VREVYIQKGDRVVPDQKLLAYDNVQLGELMGELRILQAQLRRSLTQEELSFRLLERGKELYRVEAISEKELDFRTTEHRSAEETVNSYQAEIARTVEKLRRFGATDEQIQGATERSGLEADGPISLTVLKAPFSGTVIDYDVAPGEVVSPDRSLLTIADLSLVWVLADVYQHDLAAVAPGREVEVMTNSYPNRAFPARVTYIGDVIDAQTRTLKVRCVTA